MNGPLVYDMAYFHHFEITKNSQNRKKDTLSEMLNYFIVLKAKTMKKYYSDLIVLYPGMILPYKEKLNSKG